MTTDMVDVGLPDKMQMYQEGMQLVIVRKWFGGRTIIITAFAVFWDGFLYFWYTHAPSDVSSIFFWFPLLHVAAGVYITYTAIGGWLNRTYVRVGRDTIVVKTRPLPSFNDRVVKSPGVKQLYSKERIRSGRDSGYSNSYAVHAIMHDGKNLKLVTDLESAEQALYLEQKIEKYLGITNAPVRGEL